MSQFGKIFHDLVIKTIKHAYLVLIERAPQIALSAIILFIGWICALLLKKIVSKILKALGLDVLSEKIGFKHFLERGGIQRSASSLAGLGFYWLILLSTLITVLNTLELENAAQLIKQIIFFLPQIVIALVIISLGIFLGRFIKQVVEKTSRLANVPFPAILGNIARYFAIGLAVMVALKQLNLSTTIIVQSFLIIFGIVPVIFSLIFIIGGRDVAASLLAQRFLIREYKKGDRIEFDSVSGQIEHIDFISTKITDGGKEIIIPNSELAKKIVKKKV